ncbi:uncharacterized protein [Onthophagus taurus]|uniref:uncharacterized protein n=1 Tax=Onthophagus taurus TaxID=166361 RepID=UPI0039BE18CC
MISNQEEEMREISREKEEEGEKGDEEKDLKNNLEKDLKDEVNKRDPEKRQQKIDLNYEVKINETHVDDNNLTMSTKLSTDRLICKTPKETPNSSLNGEEKKEKLDAKKPLKMKCRNLELYLGVLQILFGILMTVLGVLTIIHKASLSQIGGGIWGGCLAISSGTVGLLTAAKSCCPLKKRAYDIAQTVFLALSLITVAVSQLILVLAATGLSRDLHKQNESEVNQIDQENPSIETIPNEKAILGNIGLILTSALQFITSSLACYKIARSVCPCFKNDEEQARRDYNSIGKQAFINSWLGKQSPPFYVVAAPSTLGKGSKLSSGLSVTPIYTIPPQNVQPRSLIGYPLIPAPLGNIPSPVIRSNSNRPKEFVYTQPIYNHIKELALTEKQRKRQRNNKSRSKSKEKVLTTEELTKTYTGLDRTIAEEFIDICESRNNSLCSSESSCQSCCQCNSENICGLCAPNGSEKTSRDSLINTQ